MKIIKRGKVPTVEREITCSTCKTVFSFTPSEARYTSDFRDGDFYTINCPVCGREQNVNVNPDFLTWHDPMDR